MFGWYLLLGYALGAYYNWRDVAEKIIMCGIEGLCGWNYYWVGRGLGMGLAGACERSGDEGLIFES